VRQWAELVGAIAALLWPVLAFCALLMFRPEIKRVLGRIKKKKILGQELELEESLSELQQEATAAAQQVAALPAPPGSTLPSAGFDHWNEADTKILEDSVHSPRAALLLLAAEIEREVRHVAASLGVPKGKQLLNLSQGLAILREKEALPSHVADSLKLFWQVRNQLVHGRAARDGDILRAIDSGSTILKAIRAIPHWVKIVQNPNLEIFADPGLTTRIEGARAVILDMVSPAGVSERHIFPSTRTHFRPGMRVAWEWNPERIFGPAWYRDLETAEIKQGWSESMEFIGRSVDSV